DLVDALQPFLGEIFIVGGASRHGSALDDGGGAALLMPALGTAASPGDRFRTHDRAPDLLWTRDGSPRADRALRPGKLRCRVNSPQGINWCPECAAINRWVAPLLGRDHFGSVRGTRGRFREA